MNAEELVGKLAHYAADGIGPLNSAAELAEEYRSNTKYTNAAEQIEALIQWETSKSFTTGFLTGLGGLLTLPVAIPAALAAAWVIQARLAVAIAILAGYDGTSDQVRSVAVWSLLGDAAKELVKQTGIQIGRRAATRGATSMSSRIFLEINKKVGFRLITKAGGKSILSITRLVPFFGGLIGGTMDAASTNIVGKTARGLFPITSPGDAGAVDQVAA